jgi:hypothetical protein
LLGARHGEYACRGHLYDRLLGGLLLATDRSRIIALDFID